MQPPTHEPIDGKNLDQSWSEYRRLVIGELERINRRMEEIGAKNEIILAGMTQRIDLIQSTQLAEMKVELATLKARSGMFGGTMGALTGIAVAIGSYLIHSK